MRWDGFNRQLNDRERQWAREHALVGAAFANRLDRSRQGKNGKDAGRQIASTDSGTTLNSSGKGARRIGLPPLGRSTQPDVVTQRPQLCKNEGEHEI